MVCDASEPLGYTREELSVFVGVAHQKDFLFAGSVRENVTFGRDFSDGAVWDALRTAQAAGIVSALPEGLDTPLAAGGTNLSGGQRQAITLLMATLKQPKLLLLDEHTAALDPKTAAKVLEITDRLVTENKLTALMVTHNMKDAIAIGNRLIMMNAGRIILDVSGEEKKNLTIESLLEQFTKASGAEFANDRALLG